MSNHEQSRALSRPTRSPHAVGVLGEGAAASSATDCLAIFPSCVPSRFVMANECLRWRRAVLGAAAQRQQRAFARALRNRWDKAAADKAAAEKAAADRAAAEKAAAEKAAAAKVAAEKAAAAKAAADKAAADKAAAEKAAAAKAAADKAAADKAAADKAAADKAAAEELRRRATALGLLQVLTTANIADDATLKKSIAFCDEKGVTSVSDLVEYNLVDDFIRHLGLKHVPGMKLRGMLQTPTSGLAGQLSDRLPPSPEMEPSFSLWGQPGQRNEGTPWDFRSLFGLPAAENTARRAVATKSLATSRFVDIYNQPERRPDQLYALMTTERH